MKSSTLKALHEPVTLLEVDVSGCDIGSTLFVRVTEAIEELGLQHGLTKSWDKYVEEWINSLTTMIKLTMRNFGDGLDLLKMRLCC